MVQIFGEEVSGDLNDDGLADAAVLVVQTTGGSGTFYYVAAALSHEGAFVGTQAVFIGDRITPREMAIQHGVMIVDYADHRPSEAMAVSPSLEKSAYLVLRDERFDWRLAIANDEVLWRSRDSTQVPLTDDTMCSGP